MKLIAELSLVISVLRGIGGSTMEANVALRKIVRRIDSEICFQKFERMVRKRGIETLSVTRT
jgi:hypothetical protein